MYAGSGTGTNGGCAHQRFGVARAHTRNAVGQSDGRAITAANDLDHARARINRDDVASV
jgi:hypothetical protein